MVAALIIATLGGLAWAAPHLAVDSWWRVWFVLWLAATAAWPLRHKDDPEMIRACFATASACVTVPLLFGNNLASPLINWGGMNYPELWAMVIWLMLFGVWLRAGHRIGALAMCASGVLYGMHWTLPDAGWIIAVELVLLALLVLLGGARDGGKHVRLGSVLGGAHHVVRSVGNVAGRAYRACRDRLAKKGPQA